MNIKCTFTFTIFSPTNIFSLSVFKHRRVKSLIQPELNDIRSRLMSWGYCLGDHKATAFPALKSSSVVLALAKGKQCQEQRDATLLRIHSRVDRMASAAQDRVQTQFNSLENASCTSRSRSTPTLSHLLAQARCWQKGWFICCNEAMRPENERKCFEIQYYILWCLQTRAI